MSHKIWFQDADGTRHVEEVEELLPYIETIHLNRSLIFSTFPATPGLDDVVATSRIYKRVDFAIDNDRHSSWSEYHEETPT